MKTDILYSNLLDEVKVHISEGENLANKLMDILFIGKEAIYRRLRGEVPFTFSEVATISKEFGVSLDRVIATGESDNALFEISQIRYANPTESDYNFFENCIRDLRVITLDPNSEIGSSSNMLPQTFTLRFKHLSKIRPFKWLYQSGRIESIKPFHEMEVSEKIQQMQKEFVNESTKVNDTFYIWDNMIFINIVNDIKYFAGIQLILPEDVQILKEELFKFMDYLEILTAKGRYEESGNRIHIYISDVNFETTYSYVQAKNSNFSLIRTFALNFIASKDEQMFINLKRWIQSLKRFSVLISESGELQRVRYLKKQRDIIATL